MINGILAEVQLTVGSQTHLLVISSVPERVIVIDILRSWYKSHIGFLTYGMRAIMIRKTKWKPLELQRQLPKKIVNQKQ